MTGLVDWATSRTRTIFAFIILSIAAGWFAYSSLPKEGEPDIDVPIIFVSVNFPGISAVDAERLLVKPLETELSDVDGLDDMTGFAADGYGGMLLKFDFGWDKNATLAQVREATDRAKAEFPDGYNEPTVDEVNLSEFPILIISLSGDVPERTLLRLAKDMQEEIEGLSPVLEAGLAGHRDEMLEVLIDPLKLEAYNVTAAELVQVVTNNNRLVAAGAVEAGTGQFSVKLPGSFDSPQDVYGLPIKTNGDRVVTLGDIARINLTFEDRKGTARYNGEPTIALQVVKRKGVPIIDTVAEVRAKVEEVRAAWPEPLQAAVQVDFSMDESRQVEGMVSQLEGSVLTAVALVMIVVLGALGIRSALLVGFAIPTSFLLCFALLAMFDMSITNIVMFGLILAVGMLVDGAIVVVEYADQEINRGVGPMRAYGDAAKRMFWPIVSSTATTLCAFLPMLFWPGMPGQFMGNLPVTLIFVLSASLVVALIFLPVVGGVVGRFSRFQDRSSAKLQAGLPLLLRVLLLAPCAGIIAAGAFAMALGQALPGIVLMALGLFALSVVAGSYRDRSPAPPPVAGYRRSAFGHVIAFLTKNAVMPFVAIAIAVGGVAYTFQYFGQHNNGVEFFVETEPERSVIFVRARGNLSLAERDRLLREVEQIVIPIEGVKSVFAFAGDGGLNQRGGNKPNDAIGQIQLELGDWDKRKKGQLILDDINEKLSHYPGVYAEVMPQERGPSQGKPIQIRVEGDDWEELKQAAAILRAHVDGMEGLVEQEDTRPLPGIDWELDVDVETAGRFGADVTTVGAMVNLITRGVLLDTMRPDGSDDEIDIRVRYPDEYRVVSTLDSMRVRTALGLVPLSNFVTREPMPKLGEITRFNGARFFDVKSDVAPGVNVNAKVAEVTKWLEETKPLPMSVSWSLVGDQEEQQESQAFLQSAFAGALGLMFVILLAQFNSVYNSVLVLTAVVMSVAGVMIGMLVMGQPFSIIMTGTGIVALAGIVVNNNIVLIDTYQEFSQQMPKLEAIVRTAEARIRPVLLTTITTMAGLMPMMFGISVDFFAGAYTIDAPTALWWKQLATAVVFGLGVATVLTLVVTPAALAARVWITAGIVNFARVLGAAANRGISSDRRQRKRARRTRPPEMVFRPAEKRRDVPRGEDGSTNLFERAAE